MAKISKKNYNDFDLLYHETMMYFLANFNYGNSSKESTTHLETAVMNIISFTPDVTMSYITKKLGIPKSTMTGVINRLDKKGYLKRKINESNKKTFLLELTEEGIKLQNYHVEMEKKLFKGILEIFTDEERDQFLTLGMKLYNTIQMYEEMKE